MGDVVGDGRGVFLGENRDVVVGILVGFGDGFERSPTSVVIVCEGEITEIARLVDEFLGVFDAVGVEVNFGVV